MGAKIEGAVEAESPFYTTCVFSDFMDNSGLIGVAKIGVKTGKNIGPGFRKKMTFRMLRLFHFLTHLLEHLHEGNF